MLPQIDKFYVYTSVEKLAGIIYVYTSVENYFGTISEIISELFRNYSTQNIPGNNSQE